MRAKAEVASVRRSLILYSGDRHRLDALRDHTEADSDSEVIRKALIYYEQLYEDDAKGRKLLIRDVDKNDVVIPVVGSMEDIADDNTAADRDTFVRRNLVLHPKSASRLEALCKLTNAPSASELVRNALKIYEKLVNDTIVGKKLIAIDRDTNKEVEYFIPVSRPQLSNNRSFGLLHRFGLR